MRIKGFAAALVATFGVAGSALAQATPPAPAPSAISAPSADIAPGKPTLPPSMDVPKGRHKILGRRADRAWRQGTPILANAPDSARVNAIGEVIGPAQVMTPLPDDIAPAKRP